jgi:DNA ligase D-like protein (predicted ligase)
MLAATLKMPEQAGALRDGEWIYERKVDGLRCLAVRNGADVELWSRNHLSFNARFPAIVDAVASIPVDNFSIDGELAAFVAGRTSFAALQRQEDPAETRERAAQASRGGAARARSIAVFCVFDLLHLLGRDTTHLPLLDRRELLARATAGAPDPVRPVERVEGADPTSLLQAACASGWEGLVAKRPGSTYRAGRSPDWRKLKCSARQELVVGGWTEPSGTRTGFGALLVGYYDEAGALRFAGKVGTGFDETELRDLLRTLTATELTASPFADPVPAKGVHWARPTLVAEVEFTEWTSDGKLRHPSYLGLRHDKDPSLVTREQGPLQ